MFAELEKYWVRNLIVIATGAFVASLGFNLTTPFISMFVQELGQTDNIATLSSLALSASSLMYAIMAPVWGSLADKHGKKVMFVRAGIGIAVANLLMAMSQNYIQYLLLRLLNGTLSGFIPACIMFVASNTPERKVGFALGITQSAVSIGTIMGPAIGGYMAAQVGMRYAMALAALIIFLASLLAVFASKEIVVNKDKNRKTDVIGDIKAVLAVPTLRGVIFALLLVNTALTTIQPVLALYIEQMQFSGDLEVVTGYIFSIIGISTAIGAPLISYLHRLRPPKTVFYYGLGAAAVLNILQGLATNIYTLGTERFLFGFANSAVTITANVLVTSAAPPEMRGRTFGALNGISSLGNVAGPLLGGTIGDNVGYNMPFFVGGGLFLAALGMTQSSLKDVGNEPLEN